MRVVHTSKSPYEIWTLAFLAVSGFLTLLSPRGNSPALSAIPLWGVYVWAASLLIATVTGLAAALTNRVWALYVERGSVQSLGVLLLAYVAAVVVHGNATVAAGAALLVGLAVASGFRARQLTVDIRHIEKGDAT